MDPEEEKVITVEIDTDGLDYMEKGASRDDLETR